MRKLVNHVAMCLGVFVFALCASVSSAQPPDPIVGTWKLNLAKSKYPAPAPKSMTLTVAPAAKGWAITVDAVGPDGQAQKWGYTSTFDGSESRSPGTDIDAAVFRSTDTGGMVEYKKGGKVVSTTSSTISDDGKTMTVTVKVPDAQGKEVSIVSVYDRQ